MLPLKRGMNRRLGRTVLKVLKKAVTYPLLAASIGLGGLYVEQHSGAVQKYLGRVVSQVDRQQEASIPGPENQHVRFNSWVTFSP